jgi:hypothetical protein
MQLGLYYRPVDGSDFCFLVTYIRNETITSNTVVATLQGVGFSTLRSDIFCILGNT